MALGARAFARTRAVAPMSICARRRPSTAKDPFPTCTCTCCTVPPAYPSRRCTPLPSSVPRHRPPEEADRRGRSFSSDWWALGILLHELLTGRAPFVGRDVEIVIKRYAGGGQAACETLKRVALAEAADGKHPISEEAASFMGSLLTANESERPAFKELSMHAWFDDISWEAMMRQEAEAPWVPQPAEDGSRGAGSPACDPSHFGDCRYRDREKWEPLFEGFPVRQAPWEPQSP